jgi:hypothetical protein
MHAPPYTTVHHHTLPPLLLQLLCTTIHHNRPQSSAIHLGTPPYTTLHHPTPPYTTIHHRTPPYTTVHHRTPPYTTIHHPTPPYTTIHHAFTNLHPMFFLDDGALWERTIVPRWRIMIPKAFRTAAAFSKKPRQRSTEMQSANISICDSSLSPRMVTVSFHQSQLRWSTSQSVH